MPLLAVEGCHCVLSVRHW